MTGLVVNAMTDPVASAMTVPASTTASLVGVVGGEEVGWRAALGAAAVRLL